MPFWFWNKNKNDCPVDEETRVFIENSMKWLVNTFGRQKTIERKVLTPHTDDFPITYDGSAKSARETLRIIARQMEVDYTKIHIDIYKEGQTEVDTGGDGLPGSRIFMQNAEEQTYSGGMFWGKQKDKRYHIGIEERKLKLPLELVATLAHEVAHLKLIKAKKKKSDNERLTDITTIVFGMGVFNANVAFQSYKGEGSWGWKKSGYLIQQEWAYALALFAKLRNEQQPEWVQFLTANVKADFEKSMKYLNNNY